MSSVLRNGASHPLCLGAVAVLLLNDHWLKRAWPGFVTGKLSDVAWLVVAPVVIAAVLARVSVADRAARRLALGGVGVAFVLLQLWPPLGEAWVALLGGEHVADPEDLLALPALLLARLCWRPVRPHALALPVAALACLATSYDECTVTRLPLPDEPAWDPNRPLLLGVGRTSARHDTVGVRASIDLRDADGRPVEFALASAGNVYVVCPLGGLEPATRYRWTVHPNDGPSYNHVPPAETDLGTTWFVTAASSTRRPVHDQRECQARADRLDSYICAEDTEAPPEDTGDTGHTGAR